MHTTSKLQQKQPRYSLRFAHTCSIRYVKDDPRFPPTTVAAIPAIGSRRTGRLGGKKKEGSAWETKAGERERRRLARWPCVDPIGSPNLGIRISPPICGFHRNCLSTRRLLASTVISTYFMRPDASTQETRVFSSRETFANFETFIARRKSYTRPFFVSLSPPPQLVSAVSFVLVLLPSSGGAFHWWHCFDTGSAARASCAPSPFLSRDPGSSRF